MIAWISLSGHGSVCGGDPSHGRETGSQSDAAGVRVFRMGNGITSVKGNSFEGHLFSVK